MKAELTSWHNNESPFARSERLREVYILIVAETGTACPQAIRSKKVMCYQAVDLK